MNLGMRMRDKEFLLGNDVIVEIVGGSFLDRTVQYGTGQDVIRVRHRKQICDLVARSLVTAFRSAGADGLCTFSMELEPGDCYLINDLKSVQEFLDSADKVINMERERNTIRADMVPISLNLDLGHYLSAGIEPNDINSMEQPVWNRFSHSHISCIYGKEQHYRDLPIVPQCLKDKSWRVVRDYIERYASENSLRKQNSRNCPISGAISIELEGAPYFSWIEESLKALFAIK